MVKRRCFNRKRRIADPKPQQSLLDDLAKRVRYEGSPYHKKNPGDFGLIPPSQPRPDKTLCDGAGIFEAAEAQRWLREGVRKGFISTNTHGEYPKHIWAVTDNDVVLEAQHSGDRRYHGYPLFEPDPFRKAVLKCWKR